MCGAGLRDWLVQRCTAIFLGGYSLFLLIFLFRHPDLNYNDWRALFSSYWMQGASIIALFATAWHAWIGLWTILTDYVKSVAWRYVVQVTILLALWGYVIWGIMILWGE